MKDCAIDPIFLKPFDGLSCTQFEGIIVILGFGYLYRSQLNTAWLRRTAA
jgi:hypothetical protein